MWTPSRPTAIVIGFSPSSPVDVLIKAGATIIPSKSPAVDQDQADIASDEEALVKYVMRNPVFDFIQN